MDLPTNENVFFYTDQNKSVLNWGYGNPYDDSPFNAPDGMIIVDRDEAEKIWENITAVFEFYF